MYQGLQFGKNLARQCFIFKLMFLIGYNNKFAVVRRQFLCKLFVEDNQNELRGIKLMVLSSPWAESLGIIALNPVKK